MIGPIGGIAPFLGGVVFYLLAISKDSSDNGAMFVVFGRPGAGKSTVADLAVEKLNSNNDNDKDNNIINNNNIVLGLDLDVCVPDWMKDNFSKGIYPTLQQRIEFAENACDYVAKEQQQQQQSSSAPVAQELISVISFSFVNTDLRDVFRSRFPNADWILIDTKPNEANKRIQQRQDHFYNKKTCNTDDDDNNDNDSAEGGATSASSSGDDDDTIIVNEIDPDNEDWNFAPVTFPHMILDGDDEIETNAQKIVNLIQEKQKTLS